MVTHRFRDTTILPIILRARGIVMFNTNCRTVLIEILEADPSSNEEEKNRGGEEEWDQVPIRLLSTEMATQRHGPGGAKRCVWHPRWLINRAASKLASRQLHSYFLSNPRNIYARRVASHGHGIGALRLTYSKRNHSSRTFDFSPRSGGTSIGPGKTDGNNFTRLSYWTLLRGLSQRQDGAVTLERRDDNE